MTNSARRYAATGIAALWSMAALPAPAFAQAADARSVRSGVYTEAQAIRGQELYYRHCIACHGETLAGVDQAPPLAGPQFGGNWQGAPLAALVSRIGDTMPPEQPGSLARDDSVALLAYLLWYNGLPLGSQPLGTQQAELTGILFQNP